MRPQPGLPPDPRLLPVALMLGALRLGVLQPVVLPAALTVVGAAGVFSPGQAASLTGSYGLSNWTLKQDGTVVNTNPSAGATNCSKFPRKSCADTTNWNSGGFDLGGAGNGKLTTWVLSAPQSRPYSVSFTAEFFTDYDGSGGKTNASFAWYQVGSGAKVYLYFDGSNATVSDIKLAAGQTITFAVFNSKYSAAGSVLQISGASATVPGPLPAAGAAAAFGYSRRLRRRLQGGEAKPDGTGAPPVAPAHPSAYLQLGTIAAVGLPVAFHYGRPGL